MSRIPKLNRTVAFSITSPTGEVQLSGLALIVPDGTAKRPARRRLAGAPGLIVIERSRWAALLAQWRRSPDTPRERRNRPTAADIVGMVVRRRLMAESGQEGAEHG